MLHPTVLRYLMKCSIRQLRIGVWVHIDMAAIYNQLRYYLCIYRTAVTLQQSEGPNKPLLPTTYYWAAISF